MTSISPSPEVKAILIRTHDLMTAVANEPLGVAGILLSKGFISGEIMSKMLIVSYTPIEKATILIEAVRNKVELAPSKFPELLEILSEQTCAKEVVESLRSTYQSELTPLVHDQSKSILLFWFVKVLLGIRHCDQRECNVTQFMHLSMSRLTYHTPGLYMYIYFR